MGQIGLPEKRHYEVTPVIEPVPGEIPDFVFDEPEREDAPEREPVGVPS